MAAPAETQTVSVDGRQIKLTNLEKVLYPATGTTKADVLFYYAQVGRVMLPHLRQRPVTRKRWPDGVGTEQKRGPAFFNKDLDNGTPDWVHSYRIAHKDHDNDYPVIDDLATLTWLAQLASLELHVPQWRFDLHGVPRNPDRLVLDLDPGEGVTLADCAEVARWARAILADIGHDPFPVTSGSKGIHLYAALDGTQTVADATEVARQLALALQADHPDVVTAVMKRSGRAGKVFLDWSQNNGPKTTISPYSMRGRPTPTVAAPRSWEELAATDLRQLDYAEMLARIGEVGDLLAPLAGSPVDRLSTYRNMRDARKTPEPVPAAGKRPDLERGPSEHPVFVIQEHHARRLHYDVRLERNDVLASWAVPKGPPADPKVNHLAVQTEDHPMEYASFEGGIPAEEYGGGQVKIWDAGTYKLHKWRDGKEVIVTLYGRPDGGLGEPSKFALIHTGGSDGQDEKNWLMHRMALDPDDAAEPIPGPASEERYERAVSPSKDGLAPEGEAALQQAQGTRGEAAPRQAQGTRGEAAPPPAPGGDDFPEPVSPMLATPAQPQTVLDEGGWAFEMKWDGVRVVVYLVAGRVRLLSRKGRDETATYPDLIPELAALECHSAILDGEIVVLDSSGVPRFGLLQHRINLTRPGDIRAASRSAPAHLMLFDLIGLNETWLAREPYEARRAVLADLVPPRPGARVQVPPPFEGDLDAAMHTSEVLQLEGVVAKRRNSTYQPGQRGQAWLKLKHRRTEEVVVGGWRPGNGRRAGGVGSLLVGVPTEGGLRYLGRVGSGFNDWQLDDLDARMARLASTTSPFLDVSPLDARDARWVIPSQVAEVYYGELTAGGRLRHPVWKGWRDDKKPLDVDTEEPIPPA